MVIARREGPDSRPEMEELPATLGLRVVPFTAEHAWAATEAFLRYGKGRHAAGLNFGDCQAYGMAQREGTPPLYTGDDFSKTDVARWGTVSWWITHYLLQDGGDRNA